MRVYFFGVHARAHMCVIRHMGNAGRVYTRGDCGERESVPKTHFFFRNIEHTSQSLTLKSERTKTRASFTIRIPLPRRTRGSLARAAAISEKFKSFEITLNYLIQSLLG